MQATSLPPNANCPAAVQVLEYGDNVVLPVVVGVLGIVLSVMAVVQQLA